MTGRRMVMMQLMVRLLLLPIVGRCAQRGGRASVAARFPPRPLALIVDAGEYHDVQDQQQTADADRDAERRRVAAGAQRAQSGRTECVRTATGSDRRE